MRIASALLFTAFVGFFASSVTVARAQEAAPARAAQAEEATPDLPAAGTPATADMCGRRWIERVYPKVRASVVRVQTVGGVGSGFVYGDTRHVVTAFHVVSLGRPLRIGFSTGAVLEARAVAIDPEHDLAILELSGESPAPPLVLATTNEAPEVGTEVLVIGHPLSGIEGPSRVRLEGLLDWSASRGIVSAKNPVFIQTDASVNPGNSGGPMLDCVGRVLGVVSWKIASNDVDNISFAVRSDLVARLWQSPRSLYMGTWSGAGSFALLGHFSANQSTYLGASIGLGGIIFDRVDYMLRGAYLWGLDPEEGPVVVDTRRRIYASFEARARMMLTRRGMYLAAGAGGAYYHDLVRSRRFELGNVGTNAAVVAKPLRSSDHFFRPLGTVAIIFGGAAELGYTLVPDFGDFGDSVHQVGLTVVAN